MEQQSLRQPRRSTGTRIPRAGRRQRGHRRRLFAGNRWQWWWPAIGVAMGVALATSLGGLELESPWMARLLAPWLFLFQEHVAVVRADLADDFSTALLWLQLPLYGTAVMLGARRFKALDVIGAVVALHLLAFLLLVMLRSAVA